MPSRSRRESEARAAARRRARQLERGEVSPEEQESAAEPSARDERPARGGFLNALFPPAPPLPNRPDPLAGFEYQGPMRSVVSWFYLLGHNPRAWLLPAIPWSIAQALILLLSQEAGLLQTVCVMVSVICILAAGWIGWQKPWLFALTTAIVGTLLQGVYMAVLANSIGAGLSPIAWFTGVVLLQVSQAQWLLAAFVGWYAGYFRRRLASQPRRDQGRRVQGRARR